MTGNATDGPKVGLFVTCLVDMIRPTVGFAAVKLLEDAGCRVEVPAAQVCCGQPAFNNGDREGAKAIAKQVIAAFQGYDYIVAPSGSCGGMLREHLPGLFADDPAMAEAARDFAGRCHELVSFLTDVLGVATVDAQFEGQSMQGLRHGTSSAYGIPNALFGLHMSNAAQYGRRSFR